jgi:sigma-B regulation protein RsbU (phosphoserine phosphatase)
LAPPRLEDLVQLEHASHQINSILDLDCLLDYIVDELAPSFGAGESAILLKDVERGDLVVAATRGCPIHLKGTRFEREKGLVSYVAETGHPHYAPDVTKEARYVQCRPETRSEFTIPLKIGERVIGVFSAAHSDLDGFPRAHRAVLQQVAMYIAVAVENAQLFQRERCEKERLRVEQQEAREIQQSLLPNFAPQIPGIRIEAQCVSAGAIGGDWFDYIPLRDGKWALVLADVSGKGMAAALLMAGTRAILRAITKTLSSPADVLSALNHVLVEDFPCGRFVTMIFAVLDPATRTISFANAGHPPPLFHNGDSTAFVNTDSGLPLGIQESAYTETIVPLGENFRLLLYTDGITEARDPADEEFGTSRLLCVFSDDQFSADTILEEICLFSGNRPASDDATVVLISNR